MKFLADGGYTKQHERLLVSDNIKKTERFLLTFGTFFGGLWGGRELLSWLLNGKQVLYSISVFTAFYLLCTALIFVCILYLLIKSALEYYSRK
jgi:hypothetical protein